MQGKITLITPPDIFENESRSILFMHLSEEDQATVSDWFANSSIEENVNIYFFDKEIDIPWLLHALNRCEHKFINLDNLNVVTSTLCGHILAKTGLFYRTDDENKSAICHYLNQNRITNIELFLERVFNGKNGSTTHL
jgi:hypothetical protein